MLVTLLAKSIPIALSSGISMGSKPPRKSRNALQLVIFDCDGVLVDSETLGSRVLVEFVAELGLAIPLPEAIDAFRGRKMDDVVAEVERRLGRPAPAAFIEDLRARKDAAYRRELKAIDGVADALKKIDVPVCVASSGPADRIRLALEITGLLPRFDGHIFSAYDINSWKPDPGLLLHAAKIMQTHPAACAVIEDSALGVQAAIAAGMRVWGFASTPEEVTPLAAAGAVIFRSMRDLPQLLGL
jgi:HAD superfamily hydrolase (TIGR01509 family)